MKLATISIIVFIIFLAAALTILSNSKSKMIQERDIEKHSTYDNALVYSEYEQDLDETLLFNPKRENVIRQVSEIALVTSRLTSYKIKNDGKYPGDLGDVASTEEIPVAPFFLDQNLNRDIRIEAYQYTVSEDRSNYTLCYHEMENGRKKCIVSRN